ncbi:putative Pheromone autoinducer 2 transporter [Candidatus Xenohaliotis californiensis]|uniref:Pheromone autoinducer 2 transporter n=1 Tax=Candidatus Xenohaliotis californiensis TaxID=84677 RepID=A0ABM9N7X6_9RICK|nr:putative Pheromone autoinducer 2 transporter [Candidatus Xenohaliotis californiensis]
MTSRWITKQLYLPFSLFIFFIFVLYLGLDIITPFAVSILLAYFFNPLVSRMEKLSVSRSITSFALVMIMLTGFVWIVFFIIPAFIQQFTGIAKDLYNNASRIYEWMFETVGALDKKYSLHLLDENAGVNKLYASDVLRKIPTSFLPYAINVLKNFLLSGVGLFGVFSFLLVIPLITFYMLRDWLIFSNSFRSIFPARYNRVVDNIIKEINYVLFGYVVAQFFVAFFLMVFYSTGLSLIGLKHGLFIGIFTGLVSFVPYIGLGVGIFSSSLLALLQFQDIFHLLLVLLVFTLGVLLETQVLSPKIVAKKVGIHPVLVIFSILLGGSLMGIVGIMLSVPFFAVVSIFVRIIIKKYRESEIYLS